MLFECLILAFNIMEKIKIEKTDEHEVDTVQSSNENNQEEDNLNQVEACEFQKYQDEVKALEKSHFKELMKDCELEDGEIDNHKIVKISETCDQNKIEINLFPPKQRNEILRTAKENVENRINRLNEIEIIKKDGEDRNNSGTHLKGSHLDKSMLNDAESAVFVLQGSDYTRLEQVNDEVYVKINGQYVKANDSVSKDSGDTDNQPNKLSSNARSPQNPNDVLKQLQQIVDTKVAHVQLVPASKPNQTLDQPTHQLLEQYNQQLKLYNQTNKPITNQNQVLRSQCNKTNVTYGASDLKKMTEISVEVSKVKLQGADNSSVIDVRHRVKHVKSDEVEVSDQNEVNLLKNLSQEDIRCFNQCTFCSHSLNVSNMTELLTHCRECPTLDRAGGHFTYICYVCAVYNTYKSTNMKKHLLTHFGHKAFACDACEYTCVTRSDLQRHTRKHTGEKPYACHLCAYRSSRTETLKKHLANIHKITQANYSIPELNVYNALLSGDVSVVASR
uniref:Zinc finger protein 407 n=1 Tax=Cacopsylla melanoneura TaxID=428564 RepID=A0A8D8LU75_9HEMI